MPLELFRLVNQPPELVPGEVEQPLHLRLRPLEVLDAERVDGDLLYAQLVAPLCEEGPCAMIFPIGDR